ncbi:hypothetical protein D9615_006893 [Tricholomella constricta]|uniref:Uncharacterized protein n=1 Tax=Tricholomella constricta TaxID=117010 RepID=A0A8H5M2D3_9AGAR|nr:hypothetical protein D9615_006893 [Tricholomella constricta]
MTSTLQIELSESDDLSSQFANYNHIICGPISMQRDDGTIGAKQMKAKILALLDETDYSIVFKAELDSGLAVVLKFSADGNSPTDLCEEAAAYTGALKTLQGTVIPKYYGKYSTRCPHGRYLVCIVLEDCGEEIGRDLHDLDSKEKYKILEKLGQFHMESQYHLGDFGDHNVLDRNGDYRIIGFHRNNMWLHECKFEGRWRFGEDFEPGTHKCSLLGNVGLSFDIWKREIPLRIDINGRDYACTGYPSQKVIDTLLEEDGRLTVLPFTPWFLHTWLRDIYKHQDEEELDSDDEKDLQAILHYSRETKPTLPEWFLNQVQSNISASIEP